jgi:uncharacterized protein with HEPN domain
MPHSRAKLIADILMACTDIENFCAGHCYDDFVDDRLLQAGIERELEIVGEALNRLHQTDPDWLDESIPEYRRIIGLRNIIAHGYDIVDYDIIWDLARNHVPALKARLESL